MEVFKLQEGNALAEKKVEIILESNNRKYEQEFSLLRSAMNSLAQEVQMLKDQLSKFSDAQPKERQEARKTETKEAHPRHGNFSSEDVDIQKMFYFGNKG